MHLPKYRQDADYEERYLRLFAFNRLPLPMPPNYICFSFSVSPVKYNLMPSLLRRNAINNGDSSYKCYLTRQKYTTYYSYYMPDILHIYCYSIYASYR